MNDHDELERIRSSQRAATFVVLAMVIVAACIGALVALFAT